MFCCLFFTAVLNHCRDVFLHFDPLDFTQTSYFVWPVIQVDCGRDLPALWRLIKTVWLCCLGCIAHSYLSSQIHHFNELPELTNVVWFKFSWLLDVKRSFWSEDRKTFGEFLLKVVWFFQITIFTSVNGDQWTMFIALEKLICVLNTVSLLHFF